MRNDGNPLEDMRAYALVLPSLKIVWMSSTVYKIIFFVSISFIECFNLYPAGQV